MKKFFILAFLISLVFFSVFFSFFGERIFIKDKSIASKDEEDGYFDSKDLDLGEDNVIEQVNKDELLFLLMGVDANGTKSYKGIHTDTMMLFKVNFDTGETDLMSIPRDIRVLVNGKSDKLTHAHAYGGPELTMKSIREFLNIDLDYFVKVDYNAVIRIVDAIGGVEIDVPRDMDYKDYTPGFTPLDIDIKKGKQVLNGKKAHDFLRWRKNNDGTRGYAEGDVGRIQTQQMFMKEMIKQTLKFKNILKIQELIETYYENVQTNISLDIILKAATKAKNIDFENIKTHIIPGEGKYIGDISYYVYDTKATRELAEELLADYILD